jgi:hypothetical protein
MFNLIISIIAIALVVALAGASLYYGGDAFSEGSTKAKAAAFVNQAQQIQAASVLYKANTGAEPAAVATLSPEYLASIPAPQATVLDDEWKIEGGYAVVKGAIGSDVATSITLDLCEKINEGGSDLVVCLDNGADNSQTADTAFATPLEPSETTTNVVIGMSL